MTLTHNSHKRRVVPTGQQQEEEPMQAIAATAALSHVYKAGAWKAVTTLLGPAETKERLKALWTTLGVVSALMSTFTYGIIVNPNIGIRAGEADATQAMLGEVYVVLTAVSLVFSIIVIIFTVICLSEVEYLVTPEDTHEFIVKFQFLFETILGVFSASIFTTLGAILVACFYFYSRGVAWAITCTVAAVIVVCSPLITMLALFTRVRLGRYMIAKERNAAKDMS